MVHSSSLFCPTCGAANDSDATHCFACGQSLQAASVTDSTFLKKRYRTLNQLGQGGMGAVYIAEDTALGNRLVAIKEMSQRGMDQQESGDATRAFNREALMLANLMHPHLPRIYDHFAELGRWYLVMDFIEGETLEDYLAKVPGGKLPLKEALEIGIQLCTVLDYLHTRQPPIIFRDLKPSNIMRTPAGQLYLIDFGIARHFKPGQARDTIAFGSPGYAAPEQYGKAQTGPSADIYSLGAILHQALTGEDPSVTPFFFPPLPADTTPAALQDLLTHMLDMNAHNRPGSAAEVKQELQHLQAHEHVKPLNGSNSTSRASTTPPPPSAPRKASNYIQGKTLSPFTGKALIAAIMHGGSISALAWSPTGNFIASASYDQTVQVHDAMTGRLIQRYTGHAKPLLRNGRVQALAWSPDGTLIASAGDDKMVRIWEMASGDTLFTYRKHSGRVHCVAWSPSGNFIASASGNTIHIWNPNGQMISGYRWHNDIIQTVAWSPDNLYLASASRDASALILYNTTQVTQSRNASWKADYRGHTGPIYALSWSPDSTLIASASADHTVHIWNALTGVHLLTYYGHANAVKAVAWSPNGSYLASASIDETVQIWHALTGDHFFTYRGHTHAVNAVAWSPDSTRIASGGAGNSVQVWRVW